MVGGVAKGVQQVVEVDRSPEVRVVAVTGPDRFRELGVELSDVVRRAWWRRLADHGVAGRYVEWGEGIRPLCRLECQDVALWRIGGLDRERALAAVDLESCLLYTSRCV